jgi:hypothetical protein
VPSGERTTSAPPWDPSDTSAPRSTSRRTSGLSAGSTGRIPRQSIAPKMSATSPNAAATQLSRDRAGAGGLPASNSQASPISRSRRFGSFSRHFRSRRCTFTGTPLQSGSFLTTAASTSVVVSPLKARRPMSISYSTQPNAQMSARLSTGLPRACSGLIYGAVPRSIPA